MAELLRSLLGYSRGGGVDARWLVVSGGPAFFDGHQAPPQPTPRLRRRRRGAGRGRRARSTSGRWPRTPPSWCRSSRPGDIVILHDPQTAGLVDAVQEDRRGRDLALPRRRRPSELSRPRGLGLPAALSASTPTRTCSRARSSLGTDSTRARSRSSIRRSTPFSPKNADQTPEQTLAILTRAGDRGRRRPRAKPTFARGDGTPGRVDRSGRRCSRPSR